MSLVTKLVVFQRLVRDQPKDNLSVGLQAEWAEDGEDNHEI